MKNIKQHLYYLAFLPVILACNIYEPLAKRSTPEEYVEAAQACLHKSDYACALENYNALPAGKLKNEKLCSVYLAKGGVTLKSLISVIPTGSATMLGALANTLIPWSDTKSSDLASAKTSCEALAADTTSGDTGALLKVVAYFADCAIRLAKTATYQSVAAGDACNTPNASAPTSLRPADIGPANGVISSSNPGMCSTDVSACVTDISAISGSSLTSAGLTDISNAFNLIPSELKNNAAATEQAIATARVSIRTVIP